MITAYQLRALNVDGYEYKIDESAPEGGAYSITVKDPVSCSSGSKKWTEYRYLILTKDQDVRRFLAERSGE